VVLADCRYAMDMLCLRFRPLLMNLASVSPVPASTAPAQLQAAPAPAPTAAMAPHPPAVLTKVSTVAVVLTPMGQGSALPDPRSVACSSLAIVAMTARLARCVWLLLAVEALLVSAWMLRCVTVTRL
jgi:hypothetical protein